MVGLEKTKTLKKEKKMTISQSVTKKVDLETTNSEDITIPLFKKHANKKPFANKPIIKEDDNAKGIGNVGNEDKRYP